MLTPSDKNMFKVLYQKVEVYSVNRQEKVIISDAKNITNVEIEDSKK